MVGNTAKTVNQAVAMQKRFQAFTFHW